MGSGPWLFALILYVAVDLANPLVPGAVRFADGRLEVVEAGVAKDQDDAPDHREAPRVLAGVQAVCSSEDRVDSTAPLPPGRPRARPRARALLHQDADPPPPSEDH